MKILPTIGGAGVLLALCIPSFAHTALVPTQTLFAASHKHATHSAAKHRPVMHRRAGAQTRAAGTGNTAATPAMTRGRATPSSTITNNGQAASGTPRRRTTPSGTITNNGQAGPGTARTTR